MRFFISSTIDSDKYRHFVEQAPNANFYHLLEWHQVLKETYNLTPYYIIAEDKHEIVGCIPLMEAKGLMKGKRLISLPLSHYVPILALDNEIVYELLKFLQTFQENYKYIELRSENPCNFNFSTTTSDYIYSQIHLKQYSSIDSYWDQLPQRARRNVRKSSLNIKVQVAKERQDFQRLYKFTSISKRRQGAVAYSKDFFTHLYEKALPYLEMYTGYYESIPLASILMLNYKGSSIYAYGGSTYDQLTAKHHPTDLLFWEAIKDAFIQGQQIFDFGSSPRNHSSLIQFKEKWIPQHFDLNYHIIANNYTPISREGTLSKYLCKTLKIMPLALNQLIGPIILKEAF